MKLYYSQGACSLSPHIVAKEAGIDLALEKVNTKLHTYDGGADYYSVNPKGYVPALEIKPGDVLTEGPAIVQYLGDQKPASGLVPAAGTPERYRMVEMLGYINSEIHKTYSPLFKKDLPAETRADRKAYLQRRYEFLEKILAKQEWLLGHQFTVADAYLFTVTRWAAGVELDLSAFPSLRAFQERVAARPAVQSALAAEGLLKQKAAA